MTKIGLDDIYSFNKTHTGLNTQTGGRIKRVKDFVGDDTFMVT